jgi:hypothetical protein
MPSNANTTRQDFCDWCGEDDADVSHIVSLERFSFDAYFCSLQCAARWGCAADQDHIKEVDPDA